MDDMNGRLNKPCMSTALRHALPGQPGSRSGAYLGRAVDVLPPEHPVVDGHGGVVVDELQHLNARHVGDLQHRPALRLVEEARHGDHRVFDGLF